MRLFELTGVKAHYDKTVRDLVAALHGKGLEAIGTGTNSRVFVNNAGNVYKFWVKDSGYDRFIKLAQHHQDNPFFPKLKSPVKTLTAFFNRPKEFPNKIKYVKLERLEPIDLHSKVIPDSEFYVTDVLMYFWSRLEEGEDELNLEPFGRRGRSEQQSVDDLEKHPKDLQKLKDLFEAFKLVYQAKDRNLSFDIHSGNIMRRGEQLVFVDMYGTQADIDFNKKLAIMLADLIRSDKVSGPRRGVSGDVDHGNK